MPSAPAIKTARRFFVPQVVQTSAMDCGPASLKALLEGYGINASYGRLREACQTSVDGTSINTLEDLAVQFGLAAEQVMLPTDHVLLDEAQALPAIVVVRLPNGLTHFLILWSKVGGLIQVMDPAAGRQWLAPRRVLDRLFIHRYPVPAKAWREWAGSPGFLNPLKQRLLALGLNAAEAKHLISTATKDTSWIAIATLDAATRLVTSVVHAGGLKAGPEAARLLQQLFTKTLAKAPDALPIPSPYWSAEAWPPPAPGQPPDNTNRNPPQVLLRGAVLVRVRGRRADTDAAGLQKLADSLSPELAAVLREKGAAPERAVWDALRADGLLAPSAIAAALGMASFGVMVQALLLQGMLWLGQNLPGMAQRWGAFVALVVFFVAMTLLEAPLMSVVQRLGRRLEARLRVAFLEKIPRLSDRYFHSRLTSDMTQRAHDLRSLRFLPNMGLELLRTVFQLLLTMVAVVWLTPSSLNIALAATLAFGALALLSRPMLEEADLRLRSHVGALSRFYLDALLGLLPLRTHSAERAYRREHETALTEWLRSAFDFAQVSLVLQSLGTVLYSLFAIWILFDFLGRGGEIHAVLLLFYWTLNLPVLGQALVGLVQRYPTVRNQVLRILEPLGAPDEAPPVSEASNNAEAQSPLLAATGGVRVVFDHISVSASGQKILEDVQLTIQPGEHVGIVGPSGAGKSSLVGLLLGWHKAASGECRVDDLPLDGPNLRALRRVTAWVDPAVQLWNRTLLDNLSYGNPAGIAGNPQTALEQADLFEVFARLESGLHTPLGESGGLVSGGEGQRVRFGRALNRVQPRLVILDEPFRGLDRTKRRELLLRAREHWKNSTLLCVTHDVGETQNFERVLVVENGRIIEDGTPAALAADPNSRYTALLTAEKQVRAGLWQNADWRRLWVENGKLTEGERPESD